MGHLPAHCWVLCSIPGPHLLDARSTPVMTATDVPRHCPLSSGGKILQLRTANLEPLNQQDLVVSAGPYSPSQKRSAGQRNPAQKGKTTAAAAAKSLQSCPTLCDPIDGSPPGSPVPGILQARTLTGVGFHFLLQCIKVNSESEVAQSCPTPGDPMDCSLPGSSIQGIFQAGVLEWGAISFSGKAARLQ